MKTFQIQTLGCKVNTYESEYYRQTLLNAGYIESLPKEYTDIVIINTCTVTNNASFKSRQKIAQAKKANPTAFIVVIGCYVQTHHDYLKEKYEIDLLIGTKDKNQFLHLIESKQNSNEFAFPHEFEKLPIHSFKHHKRAYIKIQDGCNQFCSYCIIPYARGRERSLTQTEIIHQINDFTNHLEIVLTGIHTGRYGIEFNCSLYDLLLKIINETNINRIRLSSIEITEITNDIIQLIKREPRIARHLHIPLQSANNNVLKAMKRPYTVEEFGDKLKYIRNEIPNICISTDLIVGFPNETNSYFEESLSFIKSFEFSFMHIFPFSRREFTKAAELEFNYAIEDKKNRVHIVERLADVQNLNVLNTWINKEIEVLCEDDRGDYCFGYSSQYLPTLVKNTSNLINRIIRCKVIEVKDEYLIAERVNYETESII